jgi:hypothetical protein
LSLPEIPCAVKLEALTAGVNQDGEFRSPEK